MHPPPSTAPPGTPAAPGGATATEPGPPAREPLRRSREHKVISGVCGGLGRYCDLDPVIFRVVLAVLGAAGGLGLVAYGFAWLLIPSYGEDENEGRRLLSGRVEGPALTAVLAALVGCGLFLIDAQQRQCRGLRDDGLAGRGRRGVLVAAPATRGGRRPGGPGDGAGGRRRTPPPRRRPRLCPAPPPSGATRSSRTARRGSPAPSAPSRSRPTCGAPTTPRTSGARVPP